MALTLKSECEGCGAALARDAEGYICSYECTFCSECAGRTSHVCPNCGGELVRRPRREVKAAVVAGQSCELPA